LEAYGQRDEPLKDEKISRLVATPAHLPQTNGVTQEPNRLKPSPVSR
jgi:hypothetical protein